MSITITPEQASAVVDLVERERAPVTLHQIGESPDLYLTVAGAHEPQVRVTAAGLSEPIEPRGAGRAAKLER